MLALGISNIVKTLFGLQKYYFCFYWELLKSIKTEYNTKILKTKKFLNSNDLYIPGRTVNAFHSDMGENAS